MPRRITGLTHRITGLSLVGGLLGGLLGGFSAGISAGLVFGLSAGLVSGLSVGLASGLAGVFLGGLARHMEVGESSLGPADVWRHDRNAGFASVLVVALVVGLLALLSVELVPGLASGLVSRLPAVFAVGLPVALALALGAALIANRVGIDAVSSPGSATFDTALAVAQLAIQHKIPLHLIAFLEDARSKHLLRTVGPVYQFRHATLQNRLAQPSQKRVPHREGSCDKDR